jgi:hypothetical protein
MKIVEENICAQVEPKLQRKAWDAPQVRHLKAGSADLESAGNEDASDFS